MLERTNFFYRLNMEQVRVECYAGMQAEEQPRRFYVNGRKVEVTAIVKRWLDGGTWRLPTMKGR